MLGAKWELFNVVTFTGIVAFICFELISIDQKAVSGDLVALFYENNIPYEQIEGGNRDYLRIPDN